MKAGFMSIDRGLTDLPIGVTRDGNQIMARIDNLTLVSHTQFEKNRNKLGDSLDSIRSKDGYMVRRDTTGSDHYGLVVLVWPEGKKEACLRIEYRPWADVRGYVRFELSPQHFGADEVSNLFAWLSRRDNLGRRVYRVLKKAWVTRIDLAVDIYGYRLRDTFISLKGARTGNVYKNSGDFDSFRVGAPTSTYHASFYEKVRVTGPPNQTRETEEIDLSTVDHKRFSRVEMRWKPKSRQLPLSRVLWAPNMLDRIRFYGRDTECDPELPAEFRKFLATSTIPEALCGLDGDAAERRRKRERVGRILKRYEWQLFNTEVVWTRWSDCVQQLGVLGRPQDW